MKRAFRAFVHGEIGFDAVAEAGSLSICYVSMLMIIVIPVLVWPKHRSGGIRWNWGNCIAAQAYPARNSGTVGWWVHYEGHNFGGFGGCLIGRLIDMQ